MRKISLVLANAFALVSLTSAFGATVTMSPLSSFGGGDGWFAPGEGGYGFLGTANLERGLAYGNDHLYLVSRNGGSSIRILNPLTGAELGTLAVDTNTITGGTFPVNMVDVGADGVIYVGNLTTSGTSAFKVYSWANESAQPVVAFNALSGLPRTGDSFAVYGSGTSTRIVASGSTSSGFVSVDPSTGTGTAVSVAGTAVGDFRLGMTFVDEDTVVGTQGGTGNPFRFVDYVGSTGTLIASPAPTSTSERPLDYTVVAGVPLLATIDTVNSLVRIYDATDPANLVLVASGNNTSGTLAANANAAGAVAWGAGSGDTISLYAMSGNQGIQAFSVTVPEPTTLALGLLGGLALLAGARRMRK
jgi:hypothetical protein